MQEGNRLIAFGICGRILVKVKNGGIGLFRRSVVLCFCFMLVIGGTCSAKEGANLQDLKTTDVRLYNTEYEVYKANASMIELYRIESYNKNFVTVKRLHYWRSTLGYDTQFETQIYHNGEQIIAININFTYGSNITYFGRPRFSKHMHEVKKGDRDYEFLKFIIETVSADPYNLGMKEPL